MHVDARRLFQKASKLAEILGDSVVGDDGTLFSDNMDALPDGNDGDSDAFQAVDRDFGGNVEWSLVSRLTRAHWEKSMASCCLGMVLQHMHSEFNSQLEYWGISDYFTLLMEHAIRGLMLLGALAPGDILDPDFDRSTRNGRRGLLGWLCCAASHDEDEDTDDNFELPEDWQMDLALNEDEVNEARDVLLVLIIAAENYSLNHDSDNFVRLLTFCKRTCVFFQRCSGSELDPFEDIRTACALRIKNYRNGSTSAPAFTSQFWEDEELALSFGHSELDRGEMPRRGL